MFKGLVQVKAAPPFILQYCYLPIFSNQFLDIIVEHNCTVQVQFYLYPYCNSVPFISLNSPLFSGISAALWAQHLCASLFGLCLAPEMWGAPSPHPQATCKQSPYQLHITWVSRNTYTHKKVHSRGLRLQELFHWSQNITSTCSSTLTWLHLWRAGWKLFS